MVQRFGGVGISLPLNQIGSNSIVLAAGQSFLVPGGTFNVRHGLYTTVQTFDPTMGVWRPAGADGNSWEQVDSDGSNYRLVNQTGCPVAALLTNAGTGYTSAPVVTAAAGGSKWTAIMGSVISTTVTIANGGSNYTYVPQIIIQPPPSPGIPATATCALTAGAISSVTVIDQGAGYTQVPPITVLPDSRDATGTGAILTAALTGSGTVGGVICTDHGSPITSGTVPALTFTGGGGSSAAATAIMDWTVTSYAVTNGGTGYAGAVQIVTVGTGIPTTASAYVNPNSQVSFLRTRPAQIVGALAATVITATGQILIDGGHIGGITSNIAALTVGTASLTVATLTLGVGGVNDFCWLQMG